MNAYEVKQAWCLLQVKLCDPCLSALKWSLPCKALYKCSALPFTTMMYCYDEVTLLASYPINAWPLLANKMGSDQSAVRSWHCRLSMFFY